MVNTNASDITAAIIGAIIIVICMVIMYTIWDYYRQRDALLVVLQTYYSGVPPAVAGADDNAIRKLFSVYQQYLPRDLVLPDSCLDTTNVANAVIHAIYTNFSHYYYSLGVPPIHKIILNLLALDVLANTVRRVQTWYYNGQVTWLNNGTWTVDALAVQMLNPVALSRTMLAGGFKSYGAPSQCWVSGSPVVPSTAGARQLQFGYNPLDKFHRTPNSSFAQAQQVGYTSSKMLDELDCADLCYNGQCDMYTWNGDTGECNLLSYYSGDSTSGLRTGTSTLRSGQWEVYTPTAVQLMDSAQTNAACESACENHPGGCDQYTFILSPPTCNVRVQNDSDMTRTARSYTADSYTCAQQCLDDLACDGFLWDDQNCYTLQFQQHPLTTIGVKL